MKLENVNPSGYIVVINNLQLMLLKKIPNISKVELNKELKISL